MFHARVVPGMTDHLRFLARNDTGATSLFDACDRVHAEIVQLLLAVEEVDVNQARTDDGASPLFIACNQGHTDIVQLLLAVDRVDVNQGRTVGGGRGGCEPGQDC